MGVVWLKPCPALPRTDLAGVANHPHSGKLALSSIRDSFVPVHVGKYRIYNLAAN